jgi:coenzyme F420-reducing hydrogenase delta subunit
MLLKNSIGEEDQFKDIMKNFVKRIKESVK